MAGIEKDDDATQDSFIELLSETSPDCKPTCKVDCLGTGGSSSSGHANIPREQQVISRIGESERWDYLIRVQDQEDEGGPLLPFNDGESPILPLNLDLPCTQPRARGGAPPPPPPGGAEGAGAGLEEDDSEMEESDSDASRSRTVNYGLPPERGGRAVNRVRGVNCETGAGAAGTAAAVTAVSAYLRSQLRLTPRVKTQGGFRFAV